MSKLITIMMVDLIKGEVLRRREKSI